MPMGARTRTWTRMVVKVMVMMGDVLMFRRGGGGGGYGQKENRDR